VISVAFFNSAGGVGKTSLVYHTAWMFAKLDYRVLAVDLDPQANLSMMALDEERLEELWPDRADDHVETLYGGVEPLFAGTGDLREAHIEPLGEGLGLLVGDLALSRIEEDLSTEWPGCLVGSERALRVTSAFWRVIREAATRHEADLVLIDVGLNLGAINRSALVASSHVVVPVAPDVFSLQGLNSLGPTLRQWRVRWSTGLAQAAPPSLGLSEMMPQGTMTPVGYVLMQQAERMGVRPWKGYGRWEERLPRAYRESVLGESGTVPVPVADGNQIQRVNQYRSLQAMAMEARKPMFELTSADGALGAHRANVQQCFGDFERLCREIARRVGCGS
jgi:cellulose biosynthesis protein BcsQ